MSLVLYYVDRKMATSRGHSNGPEAARGRCWNLEVMVRVREGIVLVAILRYRGYTIRSLVSNMAFH